MRATALAPVTVLMSVLTLLVPSPALSVPAPVTRDHLLTTSDYTSVYPDMSDAVRIVVRSPLFAPRGCEDQSRVVRGSSRIEGSVSPSVRRRAVALINQNVVRLGSRARARALVRSYRSFSEECVAWFPPRVGDQSAGMLIGWLQGGSTDWRRVLAVRVGRTVSVIDIDFTDVRPPRDAVVSLGEMAAERLG
jgi:hypothetical protein